MPPVAHAAGARPVYFEAPVDNWTEIVVDLLLLTPFQALYVSSTSDCSAPLPTWWTIVENNVVILFEADGGTTYYLCYGDIQYTPANPFVVISSGTGTITISQEPETESGSQTMYTRIDAGQSIGVDLFDAGEKVLANVTVTVTAYMLASSIRLDIVVDGETVASTTYSGTGLEYPTVNAINVIGKNFQLWVRGVSGTTYLLGVSWEITYYRYTCVYEEIGTFPENFTIASSDYLIANASTSDFTLVLKDGYVNNTYLGPDARLLLTPLGSGGFGQEGSLFDQTLRHAGWTTYLAGACGYVGEYEYSWSIIGVNATTADYVIGQEYQVQPGAGSGGAGGTIAGNATVVVSIDTTTLGLLIGAVASMGLGFYLMAIGYMRNSVEAAGISLIPLGLGIFMFMKIGEVKVSTALMLVVAGLFLALAITEFIRRGIYRLHFT